MRLAEVCVRFGAPGGAEAHVAALAGELARRGHEVVVVTSDLYTEVPWRRGGPFEPPPPGVEVVRLPLPEHTMPGLPRRMEGLAEALAAADADVLHGHSHRYPHLVTMARVARRLGAPYCVTPHYHPVEAGAPLWKRAAAQAFDLLEAARVYKGAARVFTVTSLERRYLAHLVPQAKMVTIPNGIHVAAWRRGLDGRAFREAAGLDGDYVLYAGRLASNKGLATLLRAWAILAPRHGATTLVLAGADWGQRAALEALVRSLGIGERVRFVGYLAPELHRSAVAGCRVFVLPSEWEAFGIVLLEAMAAGKACVATAVGGVPDVVRDGVEGLLVPPRDAPALAAALERVLRDDALAARLGAAGRRRAQEHDWPVLAGRLEAEFEAVLAAARAGRGRRAARARGPRARGERGETSR